MRVDRSTLEEAAAQGVLQPGQVDDLWRFLAARGVVAAVARLRAAHLLYYLGGLIALGAATLFLDLGWERLGPTAGAAIAAGVAWQRHEDALTRRLRPLLPASLARSIERRTGMDAP